MPSPTIDDLERRVSALDGELSSVRRDLSTLRAGMPAPAPDRPMAAPTPEWPMAGPAPERPATPPVAGAPHGTPGDATRRFVKDPRPPGPINIEDLLAGRVLAWIGGVALVIGIALFLGLAISRGWIDEEARTLLAAVVSLGLLAGGAVTYERRGRTDAALAAAGAGVAGGFATIAVATEHYGLIGAGPGLACGVVLGTVAALLAVRWRSRPMAVLGLVGGLASPVLAGADVEDVRVVALLGVAYAGALTVCLRLGWTWLALLAYVVVTPQWLGAGAEPAVAAAFGLLTLAAALATIEHEEAQVLLVLNALVTGAEILGGASLVVAWTLAAVALAAWPRTRAVPLLAGAHLALAAAHVLLFEAPVDVLSDGIGAEGAAATAAVTAGLVACGLLMRALPLVAAGGVAGVYLVSAVLVGAIDGEAAQPSLSAFWALSGVVALLIGRRLGLPALRIGALALLGVAIWKVFTLDLAGLDSLARVASFIALGTLLLAGAFAWQRANVRTDVESGAS